MEGERYNSSEELKMTPAFSTSKMTINKNEKTYKYKTL